MMKPFLVFVFSVLILIAPASAEVICNSKTETTNLRKGPSAKNFEIAAQLKNGHKIQVLERVTNPEGFDYLKVKYKNPDTEKSAVAYVYHETVAEACGEAASVSKEVTKTNARKQNDPIYNKQGSCNGYKIPFSALNETATIKIDFSQYEFNPECSIVTFAVTPYPNMSIKFKDMKIPGIDPLCTYIFNIRHAKRAGTETGEAGEYYLQGKAYVSGLIAWDGSDPCDSALSKLKDSAFYFEGGSIFTSETAYKAAVENRQKLNAKKIEKKIAAQKKTAEQPDVHDSQQQYQQKYGCEFVCEGQFGAARTKKIRVNTPASQMSDAQNFVRREYKSQCAQISFYPNGGGQAVVGFPKCETWYYEN